MKNIALLNHCFTTGAALRPDTYRFNGQTVGLAVYDDSRSLVTGKTLVITRAGDTSNTITLNNFELNFREKPSNRLYIGGSLL